MKFVNFRFMIPVVSVFILTACSKDIEDELNYLGKWVEEAPVENRTEIYFLNPDVVVLAKNGRINEEKRYFVEGDSLFLLNKNMEQEVNAEALYFKQINEHTLKIQNFYPSLHNSTGSSFIILNRKR